MKILLLEDNETLANGIYNKLREIGYIVDLFFNGEDGLYTLETSTYDLLILDLGLPGIDGIEIIKRLRNTKKNLPILVISARDKLDQRILGLDTGADDYLCKPFELDEVVARVHALLRRSNNQLSSIIKYNDLVFDSQSLILKREDKIIELSKRELTIFEHLLLNLNAITFKLLLEKFNIPIQNVNLKLFSGGKKARESLIKSELDLLVIAGQGSEKYRKKIKPLAVISKKRSKRWDAPTINEALYETGLTMPIIGSIRGIAVSKKFKENYPERYKLLKNSIKKVLAKRKVQTALKDKNIGYSWIGPENSKKILEELIKEFKKYNYLIKD